MGWLASLPLPFPAPHPGLPCPLFPEALSAAPPTRPWLEPPLLWAPAALSAQLLFAVLLAEHREVCFLLQTVPLPGCAVLEARSCQQLFIDDLQRAGGGARSQGAPRGAESGVDAAPRSPRVLSLPTPVLREILSTWVLKPFGE